jgi:hypothetical protein
MPSNQPVIASGAVVARAQTHGVPRRQPGSQIAHGSFLSQVTLEAMIKPLA